MQSSRPEPPALDALVETCWSALEDGAARARHPFHTGVVATAGGDGPDARTVVLRGVDRGSGTLFFHTDLRAPKVMQLAEQHRVAWLFYDPERKVQLRLAGAARLHVDDPTARDRWAESPLRSRRCYGARRGPGSVRDAADADLPDPGATLADSEAWFAHFGVVSTRVERIDWLRLHARGHRRARFERRDGGFRGSWINP